MQRSFKIGISLPKDDFEKVETEVLDPEEEWT